MRILLVNKFWYPKGGSERYTFALKDLLESKGHEVIPFAMEDERNLPTPWSEHFVSHVDFWEAADAVPDPIGAFRKLSKVLWNRDAVQKLQELLDEVQPDLCHLQNFSHQISPSILPTLARRGVPIVWTLHDYKALCPNYRMYTQGLPCERCKGHSYANAIRYRCMGSFGASAAVALEMYLHHMILNVYGKHLAAVIAPSEFLATKLHAWGWKGRIEVVPNFVTGVHPNLQMYPNASHADASGGFESFGSHSDHSDAHPVLFVGRLAEGKGIEDFVEAARQLPEIPFAVIGDGPLRAKFQETHSKFQNVMRYGALPPDETARHIAHARMLVVPSRWYENAPYVVLEAMAAGVPVVASRIGGLPELVRDGETGILIPPRDPETLAKTIELVYRDEVKRRHLGTRARAIAAAEYGPERHYENIFALYEELRRGRRRAAT